MGNRAVIGFEGKKTGIYLHWNGGEESVKAFLDCAKSLGVRDPVSDSYGVARLTQIIGNFFGGSLSLGIGDIDSLDCDNGNNGTYIVGKGWEIVERRYQHEKGEFNGDEYRKCLAYCIERNKPYFARD
jgi:hypothetical protein